MLLVFFLFLGAVLSGRSVPAIYDRRPGRFVRHLDFNHFRAIGMRRLVGECSANRFVTGERLEAVLKVRVIRCLSMSVWLTLFHRNRPI